MIPLSRRCERTSRGAAVSCVDTAAKMRAAIYDLAVLHGSLGITPWEALDLIGLPRDAIYRLRPRFSELRRQGKLHKTRQARPGGPWKKRERVWVAL